MTYLKSAAVLADDYAFLHKENGFSHKPDKNYWSGHISDKPDGKRIRCGDDKRSSQEVPMTSLTVENKGEVFPS